MRVKMAAVSRYKLALPITIPELNRLLALQDPEDRLNDGDQIYFLPDKVMDYMPQWSAPAGEILIDAISPDSVELLFEQLGHLAAFSTFYISTQLQSKRKPLGVHAIDRALNKGRTVEIPALGAVLHPKEEEDE